MNSDQYEARGRIIAQAFYDEFEKIADARSEIFNMGHEALEATARRARALPGEAVEATGKAWWNPARYFGQDAQTIRAAKRMSKERLGLAKERSGQLVQESHAAADAATNPAEMHAATEGLKKARVRKAFWNIPLTHDQEQAALAAKSTHEGVEAAGASRRNLALGVGAVGTLGAGAYAYNKLNKPAAEYQQY